MEEIKTTIEEPSFRICITQNTKGYQFECTTRANTPEEIKERLDRVVAIAQNKCRELSGGI